MKSKSYAWIFGLALALSLAPVEAQTAFKCAEKGKITYSQTPCAEGNQKAIELDAQPQYDPSVRRLRATENQQRIQAIEADQAASPAQRTPPARSEASAPQRDRAAEDNRRRECEYARGQLDQTQRLGGSVAAAIAGVNAACGTNMNIPSPIIVAPSLHRPPSVITNCQGMFCYDNQGGVYTGGGATLNRSDGKVCRRVGNSIQCP